MTWINLITINICGGKMRKIIFGFLNSLGVFSRIIGEFVRTKQFSSGLDKVSVAERSENLTSHVEI